MRDSMLKVRIWVRAEVALAKIGMQRTGKRLALSSLVFAFALFTIGMFNLGAYHLLAPGLGKPTAAFILGGVDAVLAVLVILSQRRGPQPEEDAVREIREMAVSELASEADELREEFDRLTGHVRQIEHGLSTLTSAGAASGVAVISSMGPVLELMVQSLRKRRAEADAEAEPGPDESEA